MAIAKDALDYLAAAKILSSRDQNEFTLSFRLMKPIYFLMSQSLELDLKSLLVCEGATDEALKKMGHRLNAARTACEHSGLTFSEEVTTAINWLHGYHEQHIFRYHRTGRVTVPVHQDLLSVIDPEIERLTAIVFDKEGGSGPRRGRTVASMSARANFPITRRRFAQIFKHFLRGGRLRTP